MNALCNYLEPQNHSSSDWCSLCSVPTRSRILRGGNYLFYNDHFMPYYMVIGQDFNLGVLNALLDCDREPSSEAFS